MIRRLLSIAVAAVLLVLIGAYLQQASQMTRIRALMALVSASVFLITILTIRSYKLREKYAILWLTTAAMITLVAFFPHLVETVRQWFGMQYVTSLVAVIFIFLVLVSFHYSIALSALNDKADSLAARLAIQDARLREMQKRVDKLESKKE